MTFDQGREPDKLRIFVNYALKTPEYECLSNFSRITYCCQFSAYARGFVLFRIYESRSGDAEFRLPGREKPVRTLIIPFRGFPRSRNFSSWTYVKSPKVSVLTSCKVATRWSYLGLNYKRYRQSINDRKYNLSFQLTPSSLVAGHVSVVHINRRSFDQYEIGSTRYLCLRCTASRCLVSLKYLSRITAPL